MHGWRVLLLIAASTVCVPALAEDASDLKRQGDALLSERKYVEALDAYDRSYARSPNPALHYNRARALQYLARYPEALDSLERFQRDAPQELRDKVPGLADLLAELHGKVAVLAITSNVSGRVLANGKDVGATPLAQPLRLNAGKTTIEILADGWFPFRREVNLEGNAQTAIDARLASRDTSGYLVVRSRIAQSEVFVDHALIGVVPAEAALASGAHAIRVARDGHRDVTTQIVLSAGERKELTLDPVAPTPLSARWWFWTGLGVIVAGAGITTAIIVATTERGAPSGDFSPGKVRF